MLDNDPGVLSRQSKVLFQHIPLDRLNLLTDEIVELVAIGFAEAIETLVRSSVT